MTTEPTPTPELSIERLFAIDWHVYRARVGRAVPAGRA